MADNKLNYQQARKVRKAKFSDIMLDQLAQQDTGVFGAIGKTISMKSQARMKGIKEKFDPLNIVKFMTGGSRFGPALFGKLTGRSQKDIDYFTGRTKSVVGGRNTADKLKGLGGSGDSEGINEQLSKIFSFLKASREEDVKLKELTKNSEEEISLEKDRRHKELINTLQTLMKNINSGGKVTAVPEQKNSMLDDIWEKIKGLAEMFSLLKDTIVNIAKRIGAPIARALVSAGQWALGAIETAAASGALTVGSVIAGGTALTVGATNVLSNMTDEQRNQISADVGSDTALAAQALNAGNKTPEQRAEGEKKAKKLEKLMEDAPFLTRVYGYKQREYLLNEKKLPKKEVDDLLGPSLDEPTATPEPAKKTAPAAVAPPATPKSGETEALPPGSNRGNGRGKGMENDPRLSTAPVVPNSAPVSTLTDKNNEMAIAATTSSTSDMKPMINKTVNNLSQKQERTGLRPSEISVRNDEPTFLQLIVDSTRVV